MGLNSGLYKGLVVAHILCAIVGFGTVFLNGVYAAQAKARPGPEGLAITDANITVAKLANYFIYAVAALGILLVIVSDGAWKFSDTWVGLSLGLYVVGVGLSHGLLLPNVKRLRALSAELVAAGPPPAGATGGPPPQVEEMTRRGRTVGLTSTTLHVLLVVILCLMVWKP